jgi:methylglutamate dehydrogenase subunit B
MLRLPCPLCGERDYTEFRYGGDAGKRRPLDTTTDLKAWHDYVFLFDNPKGLHQEFWQHLFGCRQWLIVERNTATNVVEGCRLARAVAAVPGMPADVAP